MSNEIETVDWSEADAAHTAMQSDYIAFCIAIAKLGDRQKDIAARYKMSQSKVAQMVVIGNSDPRIIINDNNPSDAIALYKIASAHTKHGDKVLEWLDKHPQPTRKAVDGFIAELSPKKKEAPVDKSTVGWMEAATGKIGQNVKGWKPQSMRSSTSDKKKKIESKIGKVIPESGRVDPQMAEEIAEAVYEIVLAEQPEFIINTTPAPDLSMTASQKVEAAIRIKTAQMQIDFNNQLRDGIAHGVAEKKEELEKEIARFKLKIRDLRAKEESLRKQHAKIPRHISEAEYKLVTSCLHPDKHPEDEQRYTKATLIWQRLGHLVDFSLWKKADYDEHQWSRETASKMMRQKAMQH